MIIILKTKWLSSIRTVAPKFDNKYVRLPENRLVFPVTANNAVHDAVHAGVHQLV